MNCESFEFLCGNRSMEARILPVLDPFCPSCDLSAVPSILMFSNCIRFMLHCGSDVASLSPFLCLRTLTCEGKQCRNVAKAVICAFAMRSDSTGYFSRYGLLGQSLRRTVRALNSHTPAPLHDDLVLSPRN